VLSINADDPDRDDLELQYAKAEAAASVLFNGQYPKHPPAERLSAQVLKWSFTRAIVWLGIFGSLDADQLVAIPLRPKNPQICARSSNEPKRTSSNAGAALAAMHLSQRLSPWLASQML
jgi:hypothetical protein